MPPEPAPTPTPTPKPTRDPKRQSGNVTLPPEGTEEEE